MKAGDILAFEINKNTTSLFSKLISYVSRVTVGNWLINGQDSFNHVAIYSGTPNMQYEMTFPHGGYNPIKWENYNVFVVHYQNITEAQRKQIIDYCIQNMHKKYDLLAIFTLGLLHMRNRSVCSRFVADAYKSAGIELRKAGETLISPNEVVYHSNMLVTRVIKEREA